MLRDAGDAIILGADNCSVAARAMYVEQAARAAAREIERELNRLIDSIVDGSITARSVAPRIKALETERDAVEAGRAEAQEGENVITLHPAAIDRYKRDVATPRRTLEKCIG